MSAPQVTYSRKAAKRRQRAKTISDSESVPTPVASPRKRKKVIVEVVLPPPRYSQSPRKSPQKKPHSEDALRTPPDDSPLAPRTKLLSRDASESPIKRSHARSGKLPDTVSPDDYPPSATKRPAEEQRGRGETKKTKISRTPPPKSHEFDQTQTPTRPSSPAGLTAIAPSFDHPAKHPFRTPVKGVTSLPILSPLTPLTASPLKRTVSAPADPTNTPTRPAKSSVNTLANLFDFSPSKPAPKARGKHPPLQSRTQSVAKRMLARTRTASSIVDGGSADTGLDSVISISSSASAAPQLPRNTETILDLTAGVSQGSTVPNEESQNSLPGPSTAPLQRSNVRTYAGRSRSFLVELPADGSAGGGMDADDLGLEMRESYKDLRMRWGVDNSEDDPHPVYSARSSPGPESGRKGKGKAKDRPKVVLPPNMMNDLKSITELRSKGESRRFMDEVGYLFEGMDQSANIRVRRSSALELVTKLCDSEFARRAKATDFRSRSWDALRAAGAGDGDKVLDAILVLFAALVAESPHEVNELIQKEDFVPVLWDMLATFSGKDPLELIGSGANDAQLKNAGVGKAEKLILARLRSIILSKTVLVSDEDHLSLRQLLSQALASIPPSAHHPKYFEALYHTLLSGLRPLSSRLSGYASGLPLLPEASQTTSSQDFPQFDHIANCLVILDSYLLGRWPSSDEHPALCDDVINGDEQKSLAEGLATLCVVCSIILRNGRYEEHISIAARCIESALRVLITLSHENIAWCRLLMKQKLMVPVILSLITGAPHRADSADDETDEHDAQAFDRLCLALGLLTNLVQVDESAKDLCRETKLDPSCAALRPCAYTCSCPDASSALRCLTSVYSHYLRAEDDDPGTHIIRGHLAVLFGLLMRGALDNQDIILDELPGTGLEGLIRNAKEFVGLYTEFMARIARGEGRGAEGDAEDEPEVAVAEVRVRDGATEDVAKGVIRFLEELRGR